MMRKIILVGALFFIMLSSLSLADYTCLNTTHTQFSTTITVSGSPIPVSYPEYCPFNCTNSTGNCKPSPYNVGMGDVGILIAVPLVAVIFFYLSSICDFEISIKEFVFDPFQLIFMFIGIILLLTEAGLLMNLADIMNKTGTSSILSGSYMAIMYGSDLVIFLLIIFFMVSFFKNLVNIYRSRKR